jgi:excinuclease ABC subunit A
MNFLAGARVNCEACGGARFNDESNAVHYLDLTIAETLRLTFDDARRHFANYPKIHRPIHTACELGIGYLSLGQSSTTLSGGESQRLKLVAELASSSTKHTLYLLDEPTTGLHRNDVSKLTKMLRELVRQGHTVIVIEHDPDVLLAADHVIEMGPGAGLRGGKIIFSGPPKSLMGAVTPWGEELGVLIGGAGAVAAG